MEQKLDKLKEISGVFGACVYDSGQRLLINQLPPFFPVESLASLGALLTNITTRVAEKIPKGREMILYYDEVILIIRMVGGMTVLVVGEPHMNVRMVCYSLGLLSKAAVTPPLVAAANVQAAEPASADPAPSEIAPEPTAGVSADIAYVEPFVPELKALLAKAVGPMADIIFDDAVERWQRQGDNSFERFLEFLAIEIGNDDQYERYCTLIATLRTAIEEREGDHG